MKIGIVGSQENLHKDAWRWVINVVEKFELEDVLVSGGCKRGPDQWAEEAYSLKRFNPKAIIHDVPKGDYPTRRDFAIAAHNRNQLIVDDADVVIAFWNGFSGGTHDTIQKTRKANKRLIIIQSPREAEYLLENFDKNIGRVKND